MMSAPTETEDPPCKKQKLSHDDKTEESDKTEPTSFGQEEITDPADCLKTHDVPSTEKDVGILEYISCHQGFNGIIKQRFSDFLVREINLEGSIVHLSEVSEPECDNKTLGKIPKSTTQLTDTDCDNLKQLEEKQSAEVLIQVGDDKERRGAIHQLIRQNYSNLESSTMDKDGQKYIKVIRRTGPKGNRERNAPWPSDRGDICKFVLYKENKDTMEAINQLAKFLRTKPNSLTYAGTKDRRGKTTQEVTIYRVTATRLHQLNKILQGIKLGNFSYCKEKLKLGDLKGNHFTVVLRNVDGTQSEIEKAVTSLKEIGFINYYGMQRFGTTSVPTHHIGRSMIKSQWEEAIGLILKPRKEDRNEIAAARKIWSTTKDAKKALESLGCKNCIEGQLLLGLDKYKENDFVSALNMIPRNTRLMYIHAYQSYVWNVAVSRRVKEYGLRPVNGDLAIKSSELNVEDECAEVSSRAEVRPTPVVVTADNIGDFTIHDIVLPLPGYDIIYPENKTSQWYDEILQEHGLKKSSFKHNIRDYSLPGNYRKIVVQPERMGWELIPYNDVTVPLVLSDLDVLNGVQEENPVTDGKLRALKLEFTLPSSAYATMVLREVLKTDTSAAHQTTLNVT